MMKNNAVGWFEIYVEDIDRAKSFYESVLARPLEKLPMPDSVDQDTEMWAFPQNEEGYGAPGALVKSPDVDAGQNSVLIYFSCEDCANEEARIESAGGRIEQSKVSIGDYGFMALAYDTEGNRFGLHSLN